MKLVIEISKNDYWLACNHPETLIGVYAQAIKNGTPLPKGHGDLIDRNLALSDDGLCEFHMYYDYVKMRNYLKSIPPIIEADKEGEE